MTETEAEISVVPADESSWDDVQTVLGTRGPAARCQCQRFKLRRLESFAAFPVAERAQRLRDQTDVGHAGSASTSGLVADLGGEPVGWCAVEPRTAYTAPRPQQPRPLGRTYRGQDRRHGLGRHLLLHPCWFPAAWGQSSTCSRRCGLQPRRWRPCCRRGLPDHDDEGDVGGTHRRGPEHFRECGLRRGQPSDTCDES